MGWGKKLLQRIWKFIYCAEKKNFFYYVHKLKKSNPVKVKNWRNARNFSGVRSHVEIFETLIEIFFALKKNSPCAKTRVFSFVVLHKNLFLGISSKNAFTFFSSKTSKKLSFKNLKRNFFSLISSDKNIQFFKKGIFGFLIFFLRRLKNKLRFVTWLFTYKKTLIPSAFIIVYYNSHSRVFSVNFISHLGEVLII